MFRIYWITSLPVDFLFIFVCSILSFRVNICAGLSGAQHSEFEFEFNIQFQFVVGLPLMHEVMENIRRFLFYQWQEFSQACEVFMTIGTKHH